MDFENTMSNWQNEGIEPSSDLQANGFQPGQRPPASVFNWQWHQSSAAITELQEKLSSEEAARTSADSTINTTLGNKVDKVSGKGLSTNDFTAAYKTKLDGVATGAEVNQNAFSNIVVGSTTIAADGKTDTLTLVAGSNITLTPDATNDKVTIAASNSYSHPTYTARTGVPTANQTPDFGGTFTVTQPVSDGTGHITAMNSRTITIPSLTKSNVTTALGFVPPTGDTTYSLSKSGSSSIKLTGSDGTVSTVSVVGVGLSVEDTVMPIGSGSTETGGTGAEVFNDYETPTAATTMTYTWKRYSATDGISLSTTTTKITVDCTTEFYKKDDLALDSSGNVTLSGSGDTYADMRYASVEGKYFEDGGDVYKVNEYSGSSVYEGEATCYAVTGIGEAGQGTYIDTVTSTNASAYPADGASGGYYYVYQSASSSTTSSDTLSKGNSATGAYSTARGSRNIVTGDYAFASGENLRVVGDWQSAFGRYNVEYAGPTSATDTTGSLFMVGQGTSSARKNAFRITTTGNVYGVGSFKTTGADYAEMWEIEDGNPNNEDWRGYFVTVNEDNKIRKATPDDDYILGITSATPIVLGDVYPDMWQGAYLTDEFGEKLVEVVEVEESVDENGKVIPAHIEKRWVMNPEYDATKEYISREDRPEWVAVGLLGKLVVRQDGSCVAGGYCAVAKDGKATFDTMGYKVLKVIDSEHVQVLFR